MDKPFSTEHLLAQAAEQATTAILLLHAKPGESMPRIIYANPEIQASTGHAPAELIGKPVSIFHGPETDAVAETADQVELLTAFGCTQGQGHFFSQPVPANEFAQWLARQDAADGALKTPLAKHRRRGRFQEAIEGFEARPASNA